jgi:hypothetical protein
MADDSSKRKHKPTRVDPNNAEAVRIEKFHQRKKQRLAKKAGNPVKTSKGSSRCASVEEVEDEDVVKATNCPKAKNPRHVLESSDNEDSDDDEITILDQPPKAQPKTSASKNHKANSESESSESESSDEAPEKPEESDTAELGKIQII